MRISEEEQQDLELLKAFLREHNYPEPYYTTKEVIEIYKITSFCYSISFCTRRADGVKGNMRFADAEACIGEGHYARLYFGFVAS